jgi:3'-5' exonuclease
MRYAVFDIETRIDKTLVRNTFFRSEPIDDETAYGRMRQRLLEEQSGRSDFFPLSCHVPISVAVGEVDDDLVLTGVETLAAEPYSEELLARVFWERLERFKGCLVSFNGRSFDLPVMELAALRYGCAAPAYFNEPRGHRNRYGSAHYDLYDFLSNYGAYRLRGGFHLLAQLAGLPGKGSTDGSMVQEMWEAGRLDAIHRYCRDDVIQTYFLLLRVERMRGRITAAQYDSAFAATAPFRSEIGWSS